MLAALAGCRANAPETRPDGADSDRDGVVDAVDLCPDDPEDRDGFEDWDGCPDAGNGAMTWGLGDVDAGEPEPMIARVDTDGDGITDDIDRCPDEREDRDGFEDADGCPDPDNDLDRLLDADDLCPNEPETYNGIDDDDGCPDRSRPRPPGPRFRADERPITFASQSAEMPRDITVIVDMIANTLTENPNIGSVRIEGHADPGERRPAEIAAARAEAVRRYLLDLGLPADRLSTRSLAGRRPLCSERSETCRARNRRVELHIDSLF